MAKELNKKQTLPRVIKTLRFRHTKEDNKLKSVQSLKSSSKLYKSLVRPLYKKGIANVKRIVLKFQGGYSASSIRRKAKQRIEADKYYFNTFVSPENELMSATNLKKFIENSINEFHSETYRKDHFEGKQYDIPKSPIRLHQMQLVYILGTGEVKPVDL